MTEVPVELLLALQSDPKAMEAFEKLPPSHQREYEQWINEAKKEQTRRSRISKMIEMLKEGGKEK